MILGELPCPEIFPEIGGAYIGCRSAPHYTIQRVESLPPQFGAYSFLEAESLCQRHVLVVYRKPRRLYLSAALPKAKAEGKVNETRADVVIFEKDRNLSPATGARNESEPTLGLIGPPK